MYKKIIIFFLFWFSVSAICAQNFVAQVSKNKVTVGEVFQVAFTLNGSGGNITYPNLKDFDVYSGPNQSQSISMVNGNFSQSTTISLFIAAKKEGKFTIGSATAIVGGQKLETNPIQIEVVSGGNQSAGAQSAQQNQKQEKNQYASEVSNDDLFVRTYLSKNKCYIGEQITLTQKVYSRVDLRGFQNVKFPPYNGFWSKQEDNQRQINLQQENVNGVNYYVAEYNTVYLFPQRVGSITIDPVELDCIVRRATKKQPRNVFEQFFGGGGYEDVVVSVKSKPVKVEVKELPAENKPLGFTNAVGNYSYKAQISKDIVKANDAINLKISLSGRGNISLLEAIKINLPESFEVYDPKVNENIKTNGGISGTKTYDYLIIPREKGEFILTDLSFSFFDPEKKQYITLPSPDIKISVLEGDGSTAEIVTPNKKKIKEEENDIRYIKTGDLELTKSNSYFFGSVMHYMILTVSFLVLLLSMFFYKKYLEVNSNISLVNERKAAKIAKKQLSTAEKFLQQNQKEQFYNEIINALHHYLGNKFGLSTADMSKDRIVEILLSKQVDNQTSNLVIEIINTCEFAKYAPSAASDDLQKVYQNTLELISQIEEQIKK
jgi:hypothetical protein